MKEGGGAAHAAVVPANCVKAAEAALQEWISWALRCRLEPFKRLAQTLRERVTGVVRGMLDGRSNAYLEAKNGMLEQSKRAARCFPDHRQFHRHRRLAHVQTQTSACSSFAAGGTEGRERE